MTELRKTPLHARHVALGAKMVDFGSWDMPLQYAGGIVAEHLATRKTAGLFDVSHMGRFIFRGAGALAFLLRALTNNAAALEPGQSQYTIIQNEAGQAIDDAYLYRFDEASICWWSTPPTGKKTGPIFNPSSLARLRWTSPRRPTKSL